ncbi:DNA repair protein RecN [Sungkyunkwania multivorans]|uniref:DNA repair protein RecN n=1 Tax=Sungkyunkwania multivorans TaxID=1173618 RepID=A0ABW3CYY4_9FLAO
MLTTLSIKNYALIDDIKVDFTDGLTIITGETGAGKSILLGGLSLVLGKRADLNSLKDTSRKCIIEASFRIENYVLRSFFDECDLDYEELTILRREILPSGKSRAFINDTPVTLNVLNELGVQLIDIHSQHQTLELTDNQFQFKVLDALADVSEELERYRSEGKAYKQLKKQLRELVSFQQESIKEHDYNTFLFNELVEAKLQPGMLAELEAEFETLNNIEEIGEGLSNVMALLNEEQIGILTNLNMAKNELSKLVNYSIRYKELFERVNSSLIELDDLFAEVEDAQAGLEADPSRLSVVNDRLQQIYALQKKHGVQEIQELLHIQHQLEEKVGKAENIEAEISEMQAMVEQKENVLDTIAEDIHAKRNAAIPKLKAQLESMLGDLGMENARFKIEVTLQDAYLANGKDQLIFLLSANKGSSFGELKKVASGGELSRIMLSIKAILSRYTNLPSIIFDEIDTGVSGVISNKIADIMLMMSETMQVFSITHLPQVAAKGNSHFKVYKEDKNDITSTHLRKLNSEERIVEIAQMLGGEAISDAAMAHAKQLLN